MIERPFRLCALAPYPFLRDGVQTFATNGGPVVTHTLLPRLAERGHRVHLLAEAPPAIAGEVREGLAPLPPRLTAEWFAFEWRTGSSPPPPDYADRMAGRLRHRIERLVGELRPDLVLLGRETHCWFGPSLCREYGLPCVLMAHGSPTCALPDGIYPEAATRRLAEHMQRVDRVVAVGPHLAAILRSLGVERVCTIPNFVDPERFRPRPKDRHLLARLGIRPDRAVVGHLSSLHPHKRPRDLVRSAEILRRRNPSVIHLVMGDGPGRAEVLDRIRCDGLGEIFRLPGEIARRDVPRYLNLCDVFVTATEREGAFPLACREAQACGRPVVMSDIPPAREAIVDGENGLLFPLGDPAALASHTERLLLDATLRRAIGEAGRRDAARQSADPWLDQYERVFRLATRR